MEKKNIIIIAAAGMLVILIAAWFIFDPFGSDTIPVAESPIVNQQPDTTAIEQPKEETKVDTSKKQKKAPLKLNEGDTYIVKEGDTLQKIAMDFYGDEKFWIDIFGANEPDIDWYDNIRPGLELKIPDIDMK